MAKKKRSYRRRKEKIPIATVAGAALTAKHIYDQLKFYYVRTDITEDQKQNAYFRILTGYDAATQTMYWDRLLATYGPVVGGAMISKYVGGKDKNGNGLNINSKLRAIPIFKI